MYLLFTSYGLLLPKLLPSDEAEIERAAVYLAQDLKKSKKQPTRPQAASKGNLPPHIVRYVLGFLAGFAEHS